MDKPSISESASDDKGYRYYLNLALDQAKLARRENEVPIGAIIVRDDKIIGTGYNKKEQSGMVTYHAEIMAIESATRHLGDWRLEDAIMYSTLEPCPMCAGAILHARLKRVVFGALDHKWGGVVTKANLFEPGLFNHTVAYQYEEHLECQSILSSFFFSLRRDKKQ